MMAPRGHHNPKNGNATDALVESVISHSTAGITDTLPEKNPAAKDESKSRPFHPKDTHRKHEKATDSEDHMKDHTEG